MSTQAPPESRGRRILSTAVRIFEEDFPSLLLALCVILLVVDVTGRYIFNHPFVGFGSISMVCFIWITYISAAAVARRGRHIVIDVLTDRFPPRVQAIVQAVIQAIVLAVIGYVLYYAWDAILNTKFVTIPGLGFSRRVLAIALLIGFALMFVYALRDIVLAVRGSITGEFTAVKETDDEEFESLATTAPQRGGYEPPAEVTEALYISDVREPRDRKGDES